VAHKVGASTSAKSCESIWRQLDKTTTDLRVSDDLGEPLKTVWLFCKEQNSLTTVRDIQRKNFAILKGKSAQEIHRYLGLLADFGYGEIDERDKSPSSVAFRAY
jgi:hypothetical protein